jgi:hypothetical protein
VRAIPRSVSNLTPNEQVSGSSSLAGSSFCLQILQKDKDLGVRVGALSAVNYPKASSSALACYELLQGTAGGVG